MQAARLLIIDEDADCADRISALARGRGYETEIAARPGDVARLVQTFRPTTVLVDASMDELGGVESLLVLSQLSCEAEIIAYGEADPRLADAIRRFGRVNGLVVVDVLPSPLHLPGVAALLEAHYPGGSACLREQPARSGLHERVN